MVNIEFELFSDITPSGGNWVWTVYYVEWSQFMPEMLSR